MKKKKKECSAGRGNLNRDQEFCQLGETDLSLGRSRRLEIVGQRNEEERATQRKISEALWENPLISLANN